MYGDHPLKLKIHFYFDYYYCARVGELNKASLVNRCAFGDGSSNPPMGITSGSHTRSGATVMSRI